MAEDLLFETARRLVQLEQRLQQLRVQLHGAEAERQAHGLRRVHALLQQADQQLTIIQAGEAPRSGVRSTGKRRRPPFTQAQLQAFARSEEAPRFMACPASSPRPPT